jgi:hypothetical protein
METYTLNDINLVSVDGNSLHASTANLVIFIRLEHYLLSLHSPINYEMKITFLLQQ